LRFALTGLKSFPTISWLFAALPVIRRSAFQRTAGVFTDTSANAQKER
jgi:hypothetical protein